MDLLPPATVAQMFTDEVARQNVSIEYSPLLDDGEAWHYNLGNWTECPAATFSAACTTARRYSSPGSFGTDPFVDYNPSAGGDALFVGLLGYGGTAQGMASTTLTLYRRLGDGGTARDLAQQWAAARRPAPELVTHFFARCRSAAMPTQFFSRAGSFTLGSQPHAQFMGLPDITRFGELDAGTGGLSGLLI